MKLEASTSRVQRLKRKMERRECIFQSEVQNLVEEHKKDVAQDEQFCEVEIKGRTSLTTGSKPETVINDC